jgi:hypothetical protein
MSTREKAEIMGRFRLLLAQNAVRIRLKKPLPPPSTFLRERE